MTMPSTGLSAHALAAIASVRRATSLRRVAATHLTVEVRPLQALQGELAPWSALAARAVEPNIFHEPAFALAAAPVLGAGVQAGLVWSQGATRELVGLFPVRIQRRRYGLPLPVLCSWTHPFAPFGTPLVHRDFVEPVIAAWLDHVASDPAMPGLMLMPYLSDQGAFASALDSVLARRRGGATASYDRHLRALLAPTGDRGSYLRRTIAPRRRKELARQLRRLEDRGSVRFDRASGRAVPAALGDFLRLEASGWKGRALSAAASHEDIRRFVIRAVTELAAQDSVLVHRLLVGQKPIAAIVTLGSGSCAWTWKIAYDEDYARYSPGAQLMLRVTEDLLSDPSILSADSLATPNHPLIDHIWGERLAIADRLIAVKPDARVPFAIVRQLESMRRLCIGAARSVRSQLR